MPSATISTAWKWRATLACHVALVAALIALVILIWFPPPLPPGVGAAPPDDMSDAFGRLISAGMTIVWIALGVLIVAGLVRSQRTGRRTVVMAADMAVALWIGVFFLPSGGIWLGMLALALLCGATVAGGPRTGQMSRPYGAV